MLSRLCRRGICHYRADHTERCTLQNQSAKRRLSLYYYNIKRNGISLSPFCRRRHYGISFFVSICRVFVSQSGIMKSAFVFISQEVKCVLNIRKYLCKITTKFKTSNLGRLTIEITKISIHSQKLTNYKTVTKRLQNGNKFSLCIFTKNGAPNLFDISKNGNYNCLELRKEPIIKRQWVASE